MQYEHSHMTPRARPRGTNERGRASRALYNASPNLCQTCQKPIVAHPGEKLAETRKRKFCSRSCAASYNNRLDVAPKKKPKALPCAQCGAALDPAARQTRPDLCPSCAGAHVSHLGQQPKSHSTASDIRNHMRQVLAERSQQCQRCGYNVHVEPTHLRPIADFPDNALLHDINASANLAYLCPNCRWEYEHGQWGPESIAPASGSKPACTHTPLIPHGAQKRPARYSAPVASASMR